MSTNRRLALVGLGALVALVCACASPQPTPETGMALVVDNKGFYDANVYVVADGAVVRRLGTVDGFSARRFVLVGPQFATSQSIALYAKTIAEGREYLSGEFNVSEGPGLKWTLEGGSNHEWLIPLPTAGR